MANMQKKSCAADIRSVEPARLDTEIVRDLERGRACRGETMDFDDSQPCVIKRISRCFSMQSELRDVCPLADGGGLGSTDDRDLTAVHGSLIPPHQPGRIPAAFGLRARRTGPKDPSRALTRKGRARRRRCWSS